MITTRSHTSKAIMKSRCISDCYLQAIITIYSMKWLHSILHSGIALINFMILSPFGPTKRTIFLLIQLMTSQKSKNGKGISP